MKKEEQIEHILSTLYDYEYINLDKFYNCKYNQELLEHFELGHEEFYDDILDSIQSFLNFETNYNVKIGDL